MVIPSSSTSSSEQAQWRAFVRLAAVVLVTLTVTSYTLVLLVDPYDSVPFSLPLERVQVADQQRLFYPALARNQSFDSAIIGNSNMRLLRPDILAEELGGNWVNLGINAASSWEQEQIFELFLRHHPDTRNILVGVDYLWCNSRFAEQRFVGATREADFPAWLYDESLRNNLPPLNLGSIEHSSKLVLHLLGLAPTEFGADGYTIFTDPEAEYDLRKARIAIYGSAEPKPVKPVKPPVKLNPSQRKALAIPALERLERMLQQLPPAARAIIVFAPYHSYYQARPGSQQAALWRECKTRVSAIAKRHGQTHVVDFMRRTPLTRQDDHYWDYKHYRVPVGDRISRLIGTAVNTQQKAPEYRVLARPDKG